MRSCIDCRFYSKAMAGAAFDRCKHSRAQMPTFTATANRAGTDKCRWMRRFFLGACGWTATLFEGRDSVPVNNIPAGIPIPVLWNGEPPKYPWEEET